MLGRVSEEELTRLYGAAWVFCLPSIYEGFGIPYIEAMASGCAVVATPNPGAIDVLDRGRVGVIASSAQLGQALLGLLGSQNARDRLTRDARKAVLRYDVREIAREYEQAYRPRP
jgi:glycosyltransferase involved in cell wall biosynthesis